MEAKIKKAREEVIQQMQAYQQKISELGRQIEKFSDAVEQCRGGLEVLKALEEGAFDEKEAEAKLEAVTAGEDEPEEAA